MDINKNVDQLKARKLFLKMMEIFGGTFPDYYGGSFIDDENNLNALIIDGKEEMAEELRLMGIVIKPCKFSYNELNDIMNKFNNYMISNPENELIGNILSTYLLEEQNEIIVEVRSADQSFIELFKSLISSSDAVKIVGTNPSINFIDTIDFPCGVRIETSKPSNISLCCRVKKGETEGFLTAGHAIPTTGPDANTLYFFKQPIATCTQLQNSGMIDAAFCEVTDPHFEVSNKIDRTDLELDTETTEAIVGEVVSFVGQRTSTSGKVVSTNLSFPVNGVFFYNMVRTNYEIESGDSGGLIYIYNPEKNKCYTVGIQKGYFAGGGASIYGKIDIALNEFGVERY